MEPNKLIVLKRVVVVTLVTVLVIAGSFQAGWTWAKTAMRLEAVRTGHARYIIVDDLGHTQFEWLEKNDVAPATKTAVK
jgi:hypothetical protein